MQLLMDKLKIKLHSLVNSGPPVMPLSFKDRILDAGINNRFYNAQEFLPRIWFSIEPGKFVTLVTSCWLKVFTLA